MDNYVSLLPQKYMQKTKRAEIMHKATLAMIVAAAVLFAAAIVSVAYRTAGQLEIASVEAETIQVDFQIIQLSDIEKKQNELLALRDIIVNIQSQDPEITGAVAGTVVSVPSGVRINSLSLSVDKDGIMGGNVSCTSSTYEDIARFINALRESDRIETVEATDSRDYDGTVAFTLTLVFAPQNEEQPEENQADEEQADEI